MSTVENEKKIKEFMDKGMTRESAKIILGLTEKDNE
ncbi:uncharacterized protein METZ01_LOCUS263361 [marine metagenome]|uniref:Uncharacterized protein n=1 Tax=marine metagenome TaxID=408172 RepID=A0A382JH57_9ZZZZ